MTARVAVRVRPGGRTSGLTGRLADGSLKITVSAPPEGGRANAELVELVSALLGVKPRQVTVARGATVRAKVLEIEGLEPSEADRRIAAALGVSEAGHGR
jgi:hypothetical protein